MVGIPPIKMVMTGGWFMKLLYQHEQVIALLQQFSQMFHHAMHNSTRELFESPPGSPGSVPHTAPSGCLLRPLGSPAVSSGFGGAKIQLLEPGNHSMKINEDKDICVYT